MGRYTKLARALREPDADEGLGKEETGNVVDKCKSVNMNSNFIEENKHTTHPRHAPQPSEPPDGGGSTNLRSTNLTNFIPVKSVKSAESEDACNAARTRLRERVRPDVVPRGSGRGVLFAGEVGVRRALEITLAYEDRFWREVTAAVARGPGALHVVARRIRKALAGIGRAYPEDELRDELLVLARELFSEADLEPLVELTDSERKDLDAILEYEAIHGEFDFSQDDAKKLFFSRLPSTGKPSNRGPFPEECARIAAYLGRRAPDEKAARASDRGGHDAA